MRHAGAEEFWRSYVASGPRTNIAHGLPTLRKLEVGDLVMIDIHPIVDGYSADICRTVCVGPADRRAADGLRPLPESTAGDYRQDRGRSGDDGPGGDAARHPEGRRSRRPRLRPTDPRAWGSSSRRRPCRRATPSSTARKPPRLWRPMWSSRWATVGCTSVPGAVRVEDTNVVLPGGHETLTSYPRVLEARG